MKHIWHATRKTTIFVVGMSVAIAGLLLSFPGIPGPGIVLILVGLAILATEFMWAQRWKEKLESFAKQSVKKMRRK